MKSLYFSIVLILLSSYIQAQDFAPIGATWYVELREPFDPSWSGLLTNTSLKDTIVKGESCRVINKSLGTIFNEISGDYVLCQRGDSIFHFIPELDSLNLVMDFGAEIGDSWVSFDRANEYVSFGNMRNQKYVVDSISYIPWPVGDSIRIQHLSSYSKMWDEPESAYQQKDDKQLIEGVGFRDALLPTNGGDGFTDGIFESQIVCYQDPSFGDANVVDGGACFTSVSNVMIERNITIFPNPTFSEVQIIGAGEIEYIEVYNIKGTLVSNKINSSSIDLSNLEEGVYILRILIENDFEFRRVIKMR